MVTSTFLVTIIVSRNNTPLIRNGPPSNNPTHFPPGDPIWNNIINARETMIRRKPPTLSLSIANITSSGGPIKMGMVLNRPFILPGCER